jgi:hypothetical protein
VRATWCQITCRVISALTAFSSRCSANRPSTRNAEAEVGRTSTASESASSTTSASSWAEAAIFAVCCMTHGRTAGHGRLMFTYNSERGTRK